MNLSEAWRVDQHSTSGHEHLSSYSGVTTRPFLADGTSGEN
ncbi:uncharacterized protein METZ01_LOCUS16923 [marine metagenome]|uniref:Uncharacterized protein n=1 Tax=marine metagenome TaxID=408172 RepID=A0A381PD08_9ZZZZ